MTDRADAGWEGVAAAAQAVLDDLPAVLSVIGAAVREHVPEYAYVSDAELHDAMTRNISALATALRERRHLTPAELRDFETTVEDRARNGVPIDKYLLAVTTAEATAWEQLWTHGDVRPDSPARLEAFNLRFAAMKAVTSVSVAAHRRIELVTEREQYERRALALRVLLRGGASEQDVREHASRLGLDLDRPYVVVRARGRGPVDSDQVQRRLGRTHPPYGTFVLWGEDVVGLVLERPTADHGLVAGVAGPVPLGRASAAHEQATLAFTTAWALGREGVHALADLGLTAAVQASDAVGRHLRDRYVAPLRASGTLGEELLVTVRHYLESGSRRDVTAQQLHLHINTVGYRIGRFTELTGADLTDLTTLAELWWLFTDLDLRPETP